MATASAVAVVVTVVMVSMSAATALAVMMVVIVSSASACVSAGYHASSYLVRRSVASVENLNLKLQIFACIRVVKINRYVVLADRFYSRTLSPCSP